MGDWSSGEQDTTLAVLRRAVAAVPTAVFLDIGGVRTTYERFFARTMRLAHGLRDHGVEPGHTVVTLLDNSIDAVTVWFAVNAVGAVHVPINTAYKGEFLRHQVADAGAALVVAESDYAERVLAVADGLPALRLLFCRGPVPPASGPALVGLGELDELRSDDERDTGFVPDPSDLSMLIYTAGTTGPSKGCMISHNYACNLARQSNAMSTRRPDETLWTPLPLFHLNATATGVLTTAQLGGRISLFPRFSLSGFWGEVERSGASMVSLLGAPISLIARMPETPAMLACHGRLRIAYGAPFPADLARIWRDRFGVALAGAPGYGLSEASMIVTKPLSADPVPGTTGRRNDDFDVRIVDGNDRELPPGETGEIICRPQRPHVMFAGYWNRPEATAAVLRNLWFHTGDLGSFDADGEFSFVDRLKDYLRRRGENISSVELETTFLQHPDVDEVAVHAVPSEFTEDDVKVTATLVDGAVVSEEELCLWAVDRLPYFAVPRYVEFRTSLPKNPVGRVLKYELRADGVTGSTWDRETSGVRLVKR